MPENIEYVLISYGIWIAAFLGYLLWTWNRQHTCQQQLEDLKISPNFSKIPQTYTVWEHT